MLQEISLRRTSDIKVGDIIEVGTHRLVIGDYGKGGIATRTHICLDKSIEERKYRSDGLYVGGNIYALSSSCILQLHKYGCKVWRNLPDDLPFDVTTVTQVEGKNQVEVRVGDTVIRIDVRAAD